MIVDRADPMKNLDVDRIFLFRDPVEGVDLDPQRVDPPVRANSKPSPKRTAYHLDELNPAFTTAVIRLVTKVKDILDGAKMTPLVENCSNLELKMQVLNRLFHALPTP